MKQGILIFAHNSRSIDYAKLAIIAGGLAKKNLKKPVSLVTDDTTFQWIKDSKIELDVKEIFENVILTEKPGLDNQRNLYDGDSKETIPFFNKNRYSAYDLTPYDQTLLIDSDYLIFSDVLNNFWSKELAISEAVADIHHTNRYGYNDRYISDTGIKMYWATNFIFTKNEKSKLFFELVADIKNKYRYYSDIYRFNPKTFRNDIAFSVAKHILNGFATDNSTTLPPVKTAMDRDILHKVHQTGRVDILVSTDSHTNYALSSFVNVDLHIMNKQSIIRNYNELKKLI